MSDAPEDLERIQRELAYYQRECNELGARLLRLNEEQSRTYREAHRRGTVVRLMREVYRLWDRASGPESINLKTLSVICDNALCDRAMLLREQASGTGIFKVINVVGFADASPPASVELSRPPSFYYTTGEAGRNESTAASLIACIGLPYLMWAFDRPSGYAMLVGNRHEANASQPFEEGDREIIETALSVYLDALVRRTKPALTQGPVQVAPIVDGSVVHSRDAGLQESEIQEKIRDGERIVGMIVVERSDDSGFEYAPYFSTSWRPGYCIFRTSKNRSDRTYKDINRLLQFVRSDCDYGGPVTVYAAGAQDLNQLHGIKQSDLHPRSVPRLVTQRGRSLASAPTS